MVMTVDSHHHFWDTTSGRFEYPWMTGPAAVLAGARGPDELRPLLERARIDRTVLVQTISSVEETEHFLAIAEDTDFVGGVVGWVDLTSPATGESIDRLRARSDGRWLKGIRHQVHDEDDPEWLLRADVRRGLRAVAEAGLVYDLLVRPRELPATLELVAELPDQRFVVDHIAKPPIASGELEPWAGHMRRLAQHPGVSVKVSGMVTEADWAAWSVDDLRPYVDRLLEWFGPARLMFGSDWPVCTLAADYEAVQAAAAELMAGLSSEEQAAVFGGTAATVYDLAPIAGAEPQ
jgi:L-fuconolactonase